MSFRIENKVALISGGASGIGLQYAKELLRNGLRAITLADVNPDFGKNALEEIQKEFGFNKAIYVQVDVTNKANFEEAFKKTVQVFKNIDIVINNAGILNDAIWEKEIAINTNGVMHGMLLAFDYIPNYKSAEEGVVVNISSIAGIKEFGLVPVYTGTKFFVLGMSKAFATHYNTTKIKVLVLCPGVTETTLIDKISEKTLGTLFLSKIETELVPLPIQKVESVATAMIKFIKNAQSGTIWVVEGDQEPYEYYLNPRETPARQ